MRNSWVLCGAMSIAFVAGFAVCWFSKDDNPLNNPDEVVIILKPHGAGETRQDFHYKINRVNINNDRTIRDKPVSIHDTDVIAINGGNGSSWIALIEQVEPKN